jgi:mRNA interferase MazF
MTAPLRGEVWWCEAPDIGRRPVVVLSRDVTIPRRRRAIVAPCTTRARGLASEVALDPEVDPIERSCVVTLDAVEQVSIGMLTDRIGRLSDARMGEVCAALVVAVDCRG